MVEFLAERGCSDLDVLFAVEGVKVGTVISALTNGAVAPEWSYNDVEKYSAGFLRVLEHLGPELTQFVIYFVVLEKGFRGLSCPLFRAYVNRCLGYRAGLSLASGEMRAAVEQVRDSLRKLAVSESISRKELQRVLEELEKLNGDPKADIELVGRYFARVEKASGAMSAEDRIAVLRRVIGQLQIVDLIVPLELGLAALGRLKESLVSDLMYKSLLQLRHSLTATVGDDEIIHLSAVRPDDPNVASFQALTHPQTLFVRDFTYLGPYWDWLVDMQYDNTDEGARRFSDRSTFVTQLLQARIPLLY